LADVFNRKDGKMKIQRIFQARVSTTENREHWIVFAFTSRNEFATWDYLMDVGYSGGHYFQDFFNALHDFRKRVEEYCLLSDALLEYCAKQIGQAEIAWENLDEAITEERKADATTSIDLLGTVVQMMATNESYAGMLATILEKGYTQTWLDRSIDVIKDKAAQWQE